MYKRTHHFEGSKQARDYIREKLESYLINKGLNFRRNFNCLNPNHPDLHPSMHYWREGKRVKCFSCGVSYDVINLISIDYNLSEKEAFNKACEMFEVSWGNGNSPRYIDFSYSRYASFSRNNVGKNTFKPAACNPVNQRSTEKKDYTDYIMECKKNISKTYYLQSRGISQNIINRFNIGYDIRQSVIVLPYNSENSYYITRSTVHKEFRKPPTCEAGYEPVFNREALYNQGKRPIFVTEGVIDALSIIEAGEEAIALNGTAYNSLLKEHRNEPIENLLLLSMDNDDAGKRITEKIKRELAEKNIPYLEANFLGMYKDPNEYLIQDRQGFIKAVNETIQLAQAQLIKIEKETHERIKRIRALCELMGTIKIEAKGYEELGLHEYIEAHNYCLERLHDMEKIYRNECLKLPRHITPPKIDTRKWN